MTRAALSIALCWVVTTVLVGSQRIPEASSDALQQLAAAEAKWAAHKPAAYEFRIESACSHSMPPPPPGNRTPLVRVNGARNTPEIDPASWMAKYATVEKQFAFIRAVWSSKPVGLEVEYDQRLGYPIRVCVDPDLPIDDEIGFLVSHFRVVQGPRQSP